MLAHLIEDFKNDYPVPTREEFQAWTIKKRHDFIKKQFGKRALNLSARNQWSHLQFLEAGWAVRFKIGRKKEIFSVEIMDIKDFEELAIQAQLADRAIHSKN